MPGAELFRAAALEARRTEPLGGILLAQPLSFALLTAGAAVAAAALLAFFIWGTYTAHTTLAGQLVPEGGVIKVHAPQAGTVVAKHVVEGMPVARGDLLYVVSSERVSDALGATQEVIAAELRKRLESLEQERENTRELEQAEIESLRQAAAALRAETLDLAAMIEWQRSRAALAAEDATRYAKLYAQAFVGRDALVAREEHLLEQRLRLQGLERDRRHAERQLIELDAEVARLPAQYRNRSAELERAIAATRQEAIENEARRRVRIVAPTGGVVTGVTADVGQATEVGRPLVSIVPDDALLHAELLAPSRAVGFVRPGDSVLLRYRAYPYQKFGHHRGTVISISRSAFAAAELGARAPAAAGMTSEPLYRIVVALPSQRIDVYGADRQLRAGMLLEADLLQETRRLYEWMLEPLYTLSRKQRESPPDAP